MDSQSITCIKEAFDANKATPRTLFNYTEADDLNTRRRIRAML